MTTQLATNRQHSLKPILDTDRQTDHAFTKHKYLQWPMAGSTVQLHLKRLLHSVPDKVTWKCCIRRQQIYIPWADTMRVLQVSDRDSKSER